MPSHVKAKILSAMFVRQIGHSEHASEQDLHTAKGETNVRVAALRSIKVASRK